MFESSRSKEKESPSSEASVPAEGSLSSADQDSPSVESVSPVLKRSRSLYAYNDTSTPDVLHVDNEIRLNLNPLTHRDYDPLKGSYLRSHVAKHNDGFYHCLYCQDAKWSGPS